MSSTTPLADILSLCDVVGMDPLTTRVAARAKTYRYDRAKVQRLIRTDLDAIEDSKRTHGGYEVTKFALVPIRDISVSKVWNPKKAERVREDMDARKPLGPVLLDRPKGASRWEISDGIHRTNVSIERGFTHVPAIVHEWVETPDAYEPEPGEKPLLPLGQWVRLNKPEQGREYGWIAEVVGDRNWRGVNRHIYNVALVRPGDDWPDFVDVLDTNVLPVSPPSWGPETKALTTSW